MEPRSRAAAGPMRFQRIDGLDQLVIERPEDFVHVLDLDPARWVAASLPVDLLHADRAFLEAVDTDGNGRIRPDEVRAAVAWTLRMLADPADLVPGSDRLRLAAIDTRHPEGRAVREAAERVLANLEAADREAVTLGQVRLRRRVFARGDANGDGVVPPEAIDDEEAAALARDVMTVEGGVPDRSGAPGVDRDRLDAFLEHARQRLRWLALGEREDVRPFGVRTPRAAKAYQRLDPKVRAWFDLCDFAHLDPRLRDRPALAERELADLRAAEWDALAGRVAELPLAPARPDGRLHPEGWINPAWRDDLLDLLDAAGHRGPLSRSHWEALGQRLAAYYTWHASAASGPLADLPPERLRRWVEEPGPARRLHAILAADRAVAPELDAIDQLERLVLHQRWLWTLLNTSVSFAHFYHPKRHSLLESGTLFLDGYRLSLCVRVGEPAEHARLARASWLRIVYFEVEGDRGGFLAALVTRSGPRLPRAGQRAVFAHLDGRLADARIVHVLDHPASLADALSRPFRQLALRLGDRLERAGDQGVELVEETIGGGIQATAARAVQAAPVATEDPPLPRLAGRELLLGGSIAAAAVSTAATYVVDTLAEIDVVRALVVVGLGTSMVTFPWVALWTLRLLTRNVASVLEAAGWALHHRLGLPRFARPVFVFRPGLPADATLLR